MMAKFLAILIIFLMTCTGAHAMTPFAKKRNAGNQANTLVDIAKEFEVAAESLPTQEGVKQTIRKIDAAEEEKLNEDVEKANKVKPAHLCEGPTAEGDYSKKCPEGWQLMSDGQCWGRKYRGPCEAMSYFAEFSNEDKISFEHNCCAFWPRKVPVPKKIALITTLKVPTEAAAKNLRPAELHGPVDPSSGSIVPREALL